MKERTKPAATGVRGGCLVGRCHGECALLLLQEASLDAADACTTLAGCLQAGGNVSGALQLLAEHTASACSQPHGAQAVTHLATALIEMRCSQPDDHKACPALGHVLWNVAFGWAWLV